MRRHSRWVLAIGLVLACYGPVALDAAHTAPAMQPQEAESSAAGPKIRRDAPPAEVYRAVQAVVEEHLRPWWPRPAQIWHRPGNLEQAFSEFRGFEERVQSLESIQDRIPLAAYGGLSRMFAVWQRLRAEGAETACETDAAEPPRGGPESEVVLGTGELVLVQTDIRLPERGGVGFSLVRYYRSQVDYTGPLGPGWDHSCNQRIVAEGRSRPADALVWYTGQRAIRFMRRGDQWEPEAGAFYRLQMQPSGHVVVETGERLRLEFEPAQKPWPNSQCWRISRIAGRHDQWRANSLKFQYWPGSDVLMAVEDPYGNRVRFFHDAQGRLSAVEHGGLAVVYRYDEVGRLSQVTAPRVALRLARAEDVTWEYNYVTGLDGRNWLREVIPPGKFSEKVFEHQMAANQPGYGRVLTVTLRSRNAKPPEEAVWRFAARQAAEQCIVTYQPPSPLPAEEWTFPAEAGRVGCYPLGRDIPAHNAQWRWKHNAAGQLIEQRAPLGGITRWRYDSDHADPRFRGNLLEKEELGRPGPSPLGFVKRGWRWSYHPEIALPVRSVAFEVTPDGDERALLESSFEYDQQDLDLVRERIGERITQVVRNRFGLPVVKWDGRGCATLYRYYSSYNSGMMSARNGGLAAEIVTDASQADIAAALREANVQMKPNGLPARQAEGEACRRRSQFRYDRRGCTIWEQYPGYRIARVWNKLGQPLAVLDSRADLVVYDYDAGLRRTGQWRRIERLKEAPYPGETRPDAQGHFAAESFRYDAFGRLAAWNPTLEKVGAGEPPEVRYEYYPAGQLKKRIAPAGTAVEILYDQTTGRQKAIRLLANDNAQKALMLREAMTYDAEGFLVCYRDARGEIHQAEPDAFGRPLATRRPEDDLRRETLSDGLDRVIHERVFDSQKRLLDERKSHYDGSGRLVKVQRRRLATPLIAAGGQTNIDQWLVEEEKRYDPEGNVVARRGWREGAWHKFGYNGLGQLVWEESPDGDRWQAYYEDEWLCVETQVLRKTGQPDTPQTFILHTVTLRDGRGQPWCIIPVGYDGTVGIHRARLTHYDSQGNLAFELLPKATKTFRFFNTLGLVEQERVYAVQGNQWLAQTTNRYDPDGLLVQREVYNEPLVFSSLDRAQQEVRFERQEVPQVRKLQYDAFRRLWRETAPDGLVQEYAYGPDSRVVSLTRYHVSDPKSTEVLGFDYDRLGRLKRLLDRSKPQDPRPIQEFDYDWQDNAVKASDYAQAKHPVCVQRTYDNLGQLLREQVLLLKDGLQDPAILFEYDLPRGKQVARLEGLAGQPAGWRTLVVQQDLSGRVQQIDKDGEEFCRLEFIGQKQVAKRLKNPGLSEETTRLDPFLEPLGHQLLVDGNVDSPIYQMHYLRDDLGRIIASSMRVPSKHWECSKLYDRDAIGNLTADDTLGRCFEPKELEQKRNAVLTPPGSAGPEDIGRYHVRRYEYDQAGNLIAASRGETTGCWRPGTELVSSWNPFADVPQTVGRVSPPVRLASLTSSNGASRDALAEVDVQPMSSGEAQRKALASNRPACKARVVKERSDKAYIVKTYQYDRFGRLASYRSQATGQPLDWKIEYDVLGRVVAMKGFDAQPASQMPKPVPEQAKPDAGEPAYELRFAYDPFNRRIVKEVLKRDSQSRNGEPTVHANLYTGQRPAAKLRKPAAPDKPWTIEGQYIWGAGPSKVLAYYERAVIQSASSPDSSIIREYLLHQDVALNVVLSTCRSLGKPETIEIRDVASYWGMGENSTSGVVDKVESSLTVEQGREARWAIDRTLDSHSATWLGKKEPGYLTLKLTQTQRLAAMDVWADRLPNEFRVYVVRDGQQPQPEHSLREWEKNHINHKVWEKKFAEHQGANLPDNSENRQTVSATVPQNLPLGGREGQVIVLVWDSCAGGIQVREFEVFVQPLRPGDLAFSGTIYDAETGLYYHGARYRLPELGTFISPDPLGFFGGDNLYAFAHNDPLTWHDPDGRFAHILLGGGVGALLGAGSYVFKWWWYGEEWDWARFGIYTAAGVVGGATAAATFGASLAGLAGHGLSATSSVVISGALSAGVGGAVHGAIQEGGVTYLDTGDPVASLRAAGTAATVHGGLGLLGGAVGGAVVSQLGGSFLGFVASGAAGGAAVGAVTGGYESYRGTGTWEGMIRGSIGGAVQGGLVGGAIGGAAWGVGRAAGWIRPLPEQPEGLPDPRSKGILIRTEPNRGDYGGALPKPGYARHHIKPLSLGGTDKPDNIVEIPIDIHRQPHPGSAVMKAPHGTIFN